MSSIVSRIWSIVRHLASTRGLLLTASVALIAGSVFTSETASRLLALAAVAVAALLLLIVSIRISQQHRRIARLERDHKRLAKAAGKRTGARAPRQPLATVGPDPGARRTERLNRARADIMALRGALAVGQTAAESSEAEESATVTPVVLPGPTVTVVVPCYNESRFLGATLESVHRQSFVDWECIIVDDASLDSSVAEAYRFVRADRRFRLVRHKVNAGLSAARNTGLRLARGRLITFLDSDDMLMADSLLDRVEALANAGPTLAGSYCGMRIVAEGTTLDSLPDQEEWTDRRYVDFVSARGECPFNAHAPLLRTTVVQDAGGFDEEMHDGAEDWDLWLRIMRKGYGFIPARWRTAVYRQKRVSMAKVGAVAHVREAQRHIAQSYETAEIDDLAAPFTFTEPLPVYERQLTEARRSLQYAATALATGDRIAAESILRDEDLVIDAWMDPHIDFSETIDSGFRRALGLSVSEIQELSEEIAPLRQQIQDLVASRYTARRTTPSSAAGPMDYDTLFVPLNQAEAAVMIDVASSLPDSHSIAFINTETVTGASGVAEILNHTQFTAYSLNQWVLSRATHHNLIVAFPRDAAAEELAGVTLAGNARVFELITEGDDVMRVKATPDYGHDVLRADAGELLGLLAGTDTTGPGIVTGRTTLPLLWHGVTDPDPDSAYMVEEYPTDVFDGAAIERFKNVHAGQRCVIIGNGPSLNKLDLSLLKSEFTIGVNGIFYASDKMGFDPSFYVVEDTAVMRDNLEEIKAYRAGHKFFPSIYREQVGAAANVSYFMMNRGYYDPSSPAYCVPRFSTDAAQRVYSGQSVTIINLQLAYYMGFTEVVLIGMDFSYTIPDDAKIDGTNITSMSDDPNHFHPDYFGKGKVWKDPQLDRVLANYQLAKLMYEADGRRIVNATPGGKLDLFDRVPYGELFD